MGQAFGAMIWGLSMERIGRRGGIALGQVIGVIGSAIAVSAVVGRSLPFFLMGLVLIGMARSAVDLGPLCCGGGPPARRSGGGPSPCGAGEHGGGDLRASVGGPYGECWRVGRFSGAGRPLRSRFIGLVLAAILIFAGLRPDPRDVGRELALLYPESVPRQGTRSLTEIVRQPEVIVAMVSVIFAQMVMMVPMSITSVHMKTHQHPLSAVSLVISAHTLGMYAFSIVSGRMTDRWGRGQVIILGSVMMIVSCVMAAPSTGLVALMVALFLLGLGWNFAYVAGSALWLTSFHQERGPRHRVSTTCC